MESISPPGFLDAPTQYPETSPDNASSATNDAATEPPPIAAPKGLADYEILEEIARGGMGVVYKARQRSLDRIVALKTIAIGEWANAEDVRRFQVEAQAAANLRHPGIVAIYEIGQSSADTPCQHYFSMELIDGESLAQLLERGPLPPPEAAKLMLDIADAIQAAHEGHVIHRDLKPSNIMLDRRGCPHITDFGLAKRGLGTDIASPGQVFGTPGYMSPEQAKGRGSTVTPASDVYSLGAMLYATLTGRPPFNAATPMDTLLQVMQKEPASPRAVNPMVPRDLDAIVMKCLRKRNVERYPTAREMAEDLTRFLAGEPVHARQGDTIYLAMNWLKKHILFAGLSGTAALLIVVLLTITSMAYRTELIRRMDAEARILELEDNRVQRIRPHGVGEDSRWRDTTRQIQHLRITAILNGADAISLDDATERHRELRLLLPAQALDEAIHSAAADGLVNRARDVLLKNLDEWESPPRETPDATSNFDGSSSSSMLLASEARRALSNQELIKLATKLAPTSLSKQELGRVLGESED